MNTLNQLLSNPFIAITAYVIYLVMALFTIALIAGMLPKIPLWMIGVMAVLWPATLSLVILLTFLFWFIELGAELGRKVRDA